MIRGPALVVWKQPRNPLTHCLVIEWTPITGARIARMVRRLQSSTAQLIFRHCGLVLMDPSATSRTYRDGTSVPELARGALVAC
jgi:hypothetical protein